MKRLLLLLTLSLLSFGAEAQLSADIAAYRAVLASHFACSTYHCRTKAIEAAEADSLYGLLLRIEAAVSSAGDLDGVLTVGNTSDLTINIAGATYTAKHFTDGFSIIKNSGNVLQGLFSMQGGGIMVQKMKDVTSAFYTTSQTGPLTGNRTILSPNEGDGTGLDATVVLHTTKDSITVGSLAGLHCVVGTDGLLKTYSGSVLTSFMGDGIVRLRDPASGFYQSVYAGTYYSGLITANRGFYYPDATGTGVIQEDTIGGTGDMPVFVTEAYLNAWTGSGANISNTALRWNGDYVQRVAKHSISLDSVKNFTLKDTLGNYLINTNDLGISATAAMLYISSVSNVVKLADKTAKTYIQASIDQSKMQTFNNVLSVNSATGVSNIALNVGGANYAVADSATLSTNFTHIGGLTGVLSIAAGAGAGTLPTVSITGNDLGGYITVTTGTTPSTSAIVATITFNTAYKTAPKCIIIRQANDNAATSASGNQVHVNQADITTTTFDLKSGTTALTGATTYQWYYFVIQ